MSTPRPRMCNSPSQRSPMPVATLLISTAARRSSGSEGEPGAQSSRTPARVSWSDRARTLTPAAAACETSSAGSRTPSERRLWEWRSTRDGDRGGTRRARPAPRCSSPPPALKHANHACDGNGPAAAYIHVDHAGVEHHRARSNLEPRREAVDETRHDRGRIKADDTVYRTDHPEIGLVGGALGHDPLVRRGDVGVRAYDGADSAVEGDRSEERRGG